MNALFAVPGRPIVVRVGSATAPAATLHALATALLAAGVPTPAPIDGLCADVGTFAVTAWERVREARMAVRWEAVGEAVGIVHSLRAQSLPDDYPMPRPTGFPWWDFEALLHDVGGDVDREARTGIESAIERNAWWREAVTDDSACVVCHGDVHPGNVIVSARGPLLLDWDLLCWAPPAWDHAPLAMWPQRWGAEPATYRRFAAGSGRAFGDDPLTRALGELRNVAATLMLVRTARTNGTVGAEVEARLRYWRGDPDAPVWRAQ
jgi:aminoglycoside phosphotransferase (APT) family kinase protein